MAHVVSAYQPRYYPRLHYLARARQADTFVILDDVRFKRRSPQHRAPLGLDGEEWLTIPVRGSGSATRIDEAIVDMSLPWIGTHLSTLERRYGDDATSLRPFYERLAVSIPTVDALREMGGELRRSTDDETLTNRLEAFSRADDAFRDVQTTEETLRQKKNQIDAEIGERKRDDPTADISDLVERSKEIDERLGVVRERRRERNRRLVAVAAVLDRDETTLDWMPVEKLWHLEGVNPEELLHDVKLVDVTVPLLMELLEKFDVTSRVVRSSETDVVHPGDASEYLARLTDALGGDCYLSGSVGYENYLDESPFDDRGQDVIVQDWTPSWEDGNVCALEVLFGCDDPGQYIR